MIELTNEQIQGLGRPPASPVHFMNPQTQEKYVLLPFAEYQRLIDNEDCDEDPWTDEERDLLRLEACQMLDSFGKSE